MPQTVAVPSLVVVSDRSVLVRAPRGKSIEYSLPKGGARNEWFGTDSSRTSCTRMRTSLGSARSATVRRRTLYRSSLVRALVRSYVR